MMRTPGRRTALGTTLSSADMDDKDEKEEGIVVCKMLPLVGAWARTAGDLLQISN